MEVVGAGLVDGGAGVGVAGRVVGAGIVRADGLAVGAGTVRGGPSVDEGGGGGRGIGTDMLVGVWTVGEELDAVNSVPPAMADPATGVEHPAATIATRARRATERHRGEDRRATANSVPFV